MAIILLGRMLAFGPVLLDCHSKVAFENGFTSHQEVIKTMCFLRHFTLVSVTL